MERRRGGREKTEEDEGATNKREIGNHVQEGTIEGKKTRRVGGSRQLKGKVLCIFITKEVMKSR